MSPAKLHRHSKVRPKQERIDSSMEDVSHDLPIDSTAMPMRAASISVNIGTADASDSGGHGDDAGSSSTTVCSSTNGTRSSAPTSSISASNPTIGGTCYDDAASAMQILGRESRKLIQAIKKLEALSIDSTLPSLPEIIVIGDQSTGKSSIIEAICDLKLPRSEGTCTRCPFKITTTEAKAGNAWSCKVALHSKHRYEPDFCAATVSKTEYDRWPLRRTMDIFEFATVLQREELEDTLCRAQLAILNPDTDPASFRSVENPHLLSQAVDFSPNFVSLEIAGADLPELSLLDLPGAINTMEDEDRQYLVDFVGKLLTNSIEKDKALVLLACAVNSDIETATAFRFLRDLRALPRCIGVLTKPDLLESGPKREGQIERMLRGDPKTFKVGHGWYVTKQLSQREIDHQTTHPEARQLENDFFRNTPPWNTSFATHKDQFSVANLRNALSRELTTHIRDNLPEIAFRVQARLTAVQRELADFPEQNVTPFQTVILAIDQLKSAIVGQISSANDSEFRTNYQKVFRSLRDHFKLAQPRCKLSTPGYTKPTIVLEDTDDQMEVDAETPSKSRKAANGRRVVNDTPSRATPSSSRKKHKANASSQKQGEFIDCAVDRKIFTLDEVKDQYDSATSADLPDQGNDKVDRQLILTTMTGWNNVVNAHLQKVRDMFMSMLENVVNTSLAQYKGCLLVTEALQTVKKFFGDLMGTQIEAVLRIVVSYTHRPISYSVDVKDKKATREATLVAKRREIRLQECFETLDAEGGSVPSVKVQKEKATDLAWVQQHIGGDDYGREIKGIAQALAYFDVASQQLLDTVARYCEYGMMHSFESRLHQELLQGIRPEDATRCTLLLAEDQARERARTRLLEEQEKLVQALGELKSL